MKIKPKFIAIVSSILLIFVFSFSTEEKYDIMKFDV